MLDHAKSTEGIRKVVSTDHRGSISVRNVAKRNQVNLPHRVQFYMCVFQKQQ